MRILVTNDDGVWAPGIAALARAMASTGADVVVAAPDEDKSGFGAALGSIHRGEDIGARKVQVPGMEGLPVYAVDGPPALAVMSARLGGFGPPVDLVVSGINPGPNTGRSVLHSGTVGAALTGANFGVSAMAVSQAVGEPWEVETAASVAVAALDWLLAAPVKTVLNVNVPNLPLDQVRGVRAARLAAFGTVRAAMREAVDGRLQIELRDTEERLAEDTDTMLVQSGFVAVTALTGIRAAPGGDQVAERLEGWLGGVGR